MPSKLRRIFDLEIAAWLGAISVLYAISSIGVSIALSPWFSWTHNALSDLGVSKAAPIFNSGLIVGGTLASIFAIAFAKVERERRLGFAGAIGLIFAGISLVGIGVFSEAFGRIHFYFSLAFFVSLIVSLIVLGVRFILELETRGLGAFALSVGILGIVAWSAIRLPGVAIPEALNAFSAGAWLIVLSARLHRKGGAGVQRRASLAHSR